MSRADLACQQAALVAALVAGADVPAGFDPDRVRATATALLRKRAGEVAAHWPVLAGSYGPLWIREYGRWARARPTRGALRDGWDFARWSAASGGLGPAAATELAEREAAWRYDGDSPPVRRSAPARLLRGLAGRR